ncbi:MAG TPA: ABC transporter ATP-binding protein [Candidatus Kapabacteria bacterium]|nr:ABC transporter ATP-binding protein [Candidatus Kapabacteria bacterium]
MEYILTTNSLAKRFGGGTSAVPALQGVSLSVKPGEIYSLLGPNGAGKTTFIKCLLGIVYPTSGSGYLLGHPLGSIDAKKRIGYLPENHRYPLHLSGEQVLSYFGKLSNVESAVLSQRIDETLHLVGMNDWRTMKVRKYSKGMMQRLGLAQALINDPDLIILDEPTDGVDPVGRKEIRDVLTHLKDQGKSVFLNSHLLSEVERISDRVAILRQGKVIAEGTVDALTSQKNIYEFRVSAENFVAARNLLTHSSADEAENKLVVECDSIAELNALIDKLRSNSILIEDIHQKRSSLEDMFIQLIGSPEVTRAEAN